MKNEIFDIIMDEVCFEFMIEKSLIKTKCRKPYILFPRQLCLYFGVKYNVGSLNELANEVNLSNHATVINACNRVKNYYETEKHTRKSVDLIELRIDAKIENSIRNPRFKPTHTGKFKAMLNRKRVRR